MNLSILTFYYHFVIFLQRIFNALPYFIRKRKLILTHSRLPNNARKFCCDLSTKRLNEKEDWTTKDHSMLPKTFVNFIAQLPDKPQSASGVFSTSGVMVPASTLSDPLHAHDISSLTVETRKIIQKIQLQLCSSTQPSPSPFSSLKNI